MWRLLEDVEFQGLRMVVNNKMKANPALGLGSVVKQIDVLDGSDIELWSCGILGESNPEQLCETVLFLHDLNCALRAKKEHKMLRHPACNSQFKLLMEDGVECLQYMEDLPTKINHGGLKHAK